MQKAKITLDSVHRKQEERPQAEGKGKREVEARSGNRIRRFSI